MLALLVTAPAQAADIARVELGSRIGGLIAGPDGGAWVTITGPGGLAVGRARPDGRFTTTKTADPLAGGTVGPDGQAWYQAGEHRLLRVDGEGIATPVDLSPATGPALGDRLAAGPDGTLWATTSELDQLAHVTPSGAVTYTPSGRKECKKYSPDPFYMQLAADGAMWISDGCGLLRRAGALAQLPDVAFGLTADPSGGVWFLLFGDRGSRTVGHALADGSIGYITLPNSVGYLQDLAVAPDGSAWLTLGRCALARVTPEGAISLMPAPLPATQLAFDPAGGLWLANRMRLAHAAFTELAGACDDRAPTVRVPSRISLAALRRGIRVSVAEPAVIRVASITDLGRVGYSEGGLGRVLRRPGSVRYRLPAERLRQIARAKRPTLEMIVDTEDRDGNVDTQTFKVRITR